MMHENCFPCMFERCYHQDDTPIVDGDQEDVKVLIVFCVERPNEKGAPWVGDRTMWLF